MSGSKDLMTCGLNLFGMTIDLVEKKETNKLAPVIPYILHRGCSDPRGRHLVELRPREKATAAQGGGCCSVDMRLSLPHGRTKMVVPWDVGQMRVVSTP
jgi:hypothetical protein